MLGYLARRLAMTIPTLVLVAIGVFALVRLIPGDPVQVMLGDAADPAQAALLRTQLGLDQPIPVQFMH
jgi:peptide/nickel transport system permease protein